MTIADQKKKEKISEGFINSSLLLDSVTEFNEELILESFTLENLLVILKPHENQLVTYDKTSTGVGIFKLASHVNELGFKAPLTLDMNDLQKVQINIWKHKEENFAENASPSDLDFYNQYKSEILNYRDESSKFKDRAFYSLEELLRKFRDDNKQLLRAVL